MSDGNRLRLVHFFLVAGAAVFATGIPWPVLGADPTPARGVPPGVVKVGPETTAAQVAALAPTQVLEFPRGTRLTVAQVRSLGPLAARLRAVTGRGVLRQPLTGPTLSVTAGTERRRLENAPDATVLQLPDGRKMTAGQFKAVVPHLPASSMRRAPETVKVARGTPLAELLKRPDGDVLESPNGKKTTVGELRRVVQGLPPVVRTR